MKLKEIFTLLCLILLMSCTDGSNEIDEMETKQEYSMLQSFEFDFREKSTSEAFILKRNALNSKFDVVGLPRKNRSAGYVWFIANSGSEPLVKKLPDDADIKVDENVILEIKNFISLSKDVENYFRQSVTR